jgi:3-hydroxymyristoyl/3-hydroxydecanoyl-(acyl carrier protein) dehydratase
MWHVLGSIETSETGEWCTEVQVVPESLWFSGHFPGDPVLPAIAQLGMVFDAVCKVSGFQFRIAGFSRVKFKRMIRPGDCLKITIRSKKDQEGVYAFRILIGDEIACTGSMALEKRTDPLSLPQGLQSIEQGA